ncbi:MAG: FHA domain-containing protein [Candidatus Krumholzibacteriia bacterium]
MGASRRRGGAGAGIAPATARLLPLDGAPPDVVRLTGEPLVVGRAAEAGLVCPDPALSRRHATLTYADGAWWVEDLGSANGTTVDGEPVTRAVLAPGAVVGFGGAVRFRFMADGEAPGAGSSIFNRLLCLKLTPLEGGRSHVLRRRLTVVGRNASADLRLDSAQVSGIHARILRRDGRVLLRDTGSRNGTLVNGDTVSQASLAPGDRIAFGDVTFQVGRSPVPTGRTLVGSAAGVLVVAAVAVLAALLAGDEAEPLWTRRMYLDQVTTSLVAAIRAQDRTPPAREVALAQIDIARRSLIAADLMRPDRQTPEEVLAAMKRAAEAPEVARALRGRGIGVILDAAEREPTAPPPPPPDRQGFDLGEELSRLVAEFGIDTRDTPIPPALVAEVEQFTRFWSEDRRDFTIRARARGLPLLADMRRELRRQRLPEIFCYLPFIESGYDRMIVSKAGARGLWQFMPGTARDYGLRVDDEVDERTDPALSTRAACGHLEFLLKIFGPDSFMCAVAAYNKGHNGLRRCLERSGDLQTTWRFWNLAVANDGCLKPETVEYVPRFLAAVVVFRNPEVFGLPGSG